MSSAHVFMETFEEHQVFISFRGVDLRNTFVTHLVKYLQSNNISVFIDNHEDKGKPLEVLLERIEKSKIALVIFSEHYIESKWCLNELDKIKDCYDEGTLKVIPIFYLLKVSTVRNLEGKLGDVFRSLTESDERKNKWKETIKSITNVMGITIDKNSYESEVCLKIVEAVKEVLNIVPLEGSQNATVDPAGNSNVGAS